MERKKASIARALNLVMIMVMNKHAKEASN